MAKFLVTPHVHLNQSRGYIPGKTFTMRGGVYSLINGCNPEVVPASLEYIHGHPCQEPYSKEILDQLPVECVEGYALYGGPLLAHYGHFLIQSLARLSHYDPIKHQAIVFSYIKDKDVSGKLDSLRFPSFVSETFELLGINIESIYIVSSFGLIFDQLDIFEPEWVIPKPPTKDHLDWLRSKTQFNLPRSLTRELKRPKNVYLSRNCHFKGLTAGETQLETLLYSNGFKIVYPEHLSMSEKVHALDCTDNLISLTGSGLLVTSLLPVPPKNVVQVYRNKMASSMLLQRRLNEQSNSLNHEVDSIAQESFNANEAMSLLDIQKTLEGIEKALGYRLLFPEILDQKKADSEYRDLIDYYNLAHSLPLRTINPSYDQIEACKRLARIRMSPRFYVIAIRALIAMEDIKTAMSLCYDARRAFPTNSEVSPLYRKLIRIETLKASTRPII